MGPLASTRLIFFASGLGMAAWAPLVPYAQERAGIDPGGLGLLLLCMGAGSILAMPVAGLLAARLGCRPVLVMSTLLVAAALPLLAALSDPLPLGAALFLFGAGLGSMDCTMNIQAVIVERRDGRPLMSGFHGLFSVGGIAGAAGMALLLDRLAPLPATWLAVALLTALLALAAPALLAEGGNGSGRPVLPRGPVLAIGLFCFVIFLAEGAMLDWSAVFLTAERGLDPARGGLGYAAFSVTMTIGRLTGDALVRRVGSRTVLLGGPLVAAAGLALVTLAPSWQAALLGFALVGAGCSNVVPQLFSAIGRQTVMPEAAAVPAVSALGYAGILAGPALIGFAADATTLPMALMGLAALVAVTPVLARAVPR